MGVNRGCLGKKYDGGVYKVEASATKKYALAYNDDNPAFLDETRPGGIIAPPLFGVVFGAPAMAQAMFDPELNANLAMLVHGEQDMYFIKPVLPGDSIRTVAEIVQIEDKGTGELITVETTSTNQNNELVLRSRYGLFIRGGGSGKKAEKPPEPQKGKIVFSQKMHVKPDQSYIYAEASGDHNPIHVDENFAKSVGLPGIILQGLCTMAFASKAVIDEFLNRDPLKLKRLKVRFSKPVLPNDDLTTEGWIIEKKNGITVLGIETVNQAGIPVIKDGLAEVEV
jgi:acyl dehydratase